jgi:hypothetical protein
MKENLEFQRIQKTVQVRVPFLLRKRGGRKLIISPDGAAQTPSCQPDGTLIKALARAFRWRKLLEIGAYATLFELAAAEKINRSYVSRILRLTLLQPDIIESILDGNQSRTLTLPKLLRPLPVEWRTQRQLLDLDR